jgi:hypothetical protein
MREQFVSVDERRKSEESQENHIYKLQFERRERDRDEVRETESGVRERAVVGKQLREAVSHFDLFAALTIDSIFDLAL